MNNKGKRVRNVIISCFIMFILLGISNYVTYSYVNEKEKRYYEALFTSYIQDEEEKEKLSVIERNHDLEENASFHIDEQTVKNIQKVMIVAHPDDETLWSGASIMSGDWLIICLTNGDNSVRSKEFSNVMKATGNYGIMLSYPDNPNNIRDNWSEVKEDIKADLRYIVNYKDWQQIVTHNPAGEYGHIQHRFTSMMMTNICVEYEKSDQLYYFEKYYKKEYLEENEMGVLLTDEQITAKHNLMTTYYPSQMKTYHVTKHMIPYETFISYSDWYFE